LLEFYATTLLRKKIGGNKKKYRLIIYQIEWKQHKKTKYKNENKAGFLPPLLKCTKIVVVERSHFMIFVTDNLYLQRRGKMCQNA